MARIAGLTNPEVVTAAREGREGHNGRDSFSTTPGDWYAFAPVGRMPKPWATAFRERFYAQKVVHILFSFSTPIAWLDADYGWIMPDVSYSAITSSKHQSPAWRLRAARPAMPWDATPEDARRVLSGELVFTSKGYGMNRTFTGTVPGPNYIPEA